jgi:hypothetical protein
MPPGPPPWLFQSLSCLTSLFINLLIYKTKNLFAFSYLVKLATLKHGRQLASTMPRHYSWKRLDRHVTILINYVCNRLNMLLRR